MNENLKNGLKLMNENYLFLFQEYSEFFRWYDENDTDTWKQMAN